MASVASAAAVSGILGLALFFIAVVTGQLGASCVLDHVGWLGVAQVQVSPGRAFWMLLAALGCGLSAADRLGSSVGSLV